MGMYVLFLTFVFGYGHSLSCTLWVDICNCYFVLLGEI